LREEDLTIDVVQKGAKVVDPGCLPPWYGASVLKHGLGESAHELVMLQGDGVDLAHACVSFGCV